MPDLADPELVLFSLLLCPRAQVLDSLAGLIKLLHSLSGSLSQLLILSYRSGCMGLRHVELGLCQGGGDLQLSLQQASNQSDLVRSRETTAK